MSYNLCIIRYNENSFMKFMFFQNNKWKFCSFCCMFHFFLQMEQVGNKTCYPNQTHQTQIQLFFLCFSQ